MKTILLIHDVDQARQTMKGALEKAGLKVVVATSGLRGIALAQEQKPVLVLCPAQMEGMDGYHVARLVREKAGALSPFFVLLVEKKDRKEESLAHRGIDLFLPVPIPEPSLIETIQTLLRRIPKPKTNSAKAQAKIPLSPSEPIFARMGKFLQFTELSFLAEEHKKSAPAAQGQVHSNQISSVAQMVADRLGRGTDLNCQLQKGFLPMEMQELATLIEEIVENACTFSAPGTPIDLFFFRGKKTLEIYLRDYGCGMTQDQTAALNQSGRGVGLGLAMVKLIAQSHNGRMRIFSELEAGTTVRVEVPAIHFPIPKEEPDDLGFPSFEEEEEE